MTREFLAAIVYTIQFGIPLTSGTEYADQSAVCLDDADIINFTERKQLFEACGSLL
jgi:hypothetical protein